MTAGTPPPPPAGGHTIVRFADVLAEYRDQADAAHRAFADNAPKGPTTGLAKLDRVLGNVLEPGLHVLHGGSGVGKTAFALQVAATCRAPSLYVSCEMALPELLRRHVARVTGVSVNRLKSGVLDADEAVALAERAIAAAPQLALVDATTAYLPPPRLLQFVEAAQGAAPHVLAVVDSVHAWSQGAALPMSEYESLNHHLGELRTVAARRRCPLLAVAERNRASAVSGGISASAGSRRFEYGAESVIGLEKDDGPNAPILPAGQTPMWISLDKNRNGSAGVRVHAVFHGELHKFTD